MSRRVVSNEAMPADAGLSAIGILMRLGGGLAFWMGIYGLIAVLGSPAPASVALVILLGLGRSALHIRAGRALAGGGPGHVRMAWVYVGVALTHTLLVAVVMASTLEDIAGAPIIVALLLGSWPLVVAGLLLRPASRAVAEWTRANGQRLFAEDLGITGVAALMTAFGAVGILMVGVWLVLMVSTGVLGAGIIGWLMLVLGLGFFVRSVLHGRAGFRLLRTFDPRRFRSDNDQYFLVALLTTIVVCLLAIFAGLLSGGLFAVLLMIPVAGMLMTWPAIARDSGTVELRPDLEEDDPPPIRVSRDNGLSTLGVVLLTYGVMTLTVSLSAVGAGGGVGTGGLDALFAGLGEEVWPLLVTGLSSTWVGLELVGMTPRRKQAAFVNLAVVGGLAVYQAVGAWELLGNMPGFGRGGLLAPQMLGMIAMQMAAPIAIPLVTAVQAARPPTARQPEIEDVF